MKFAAVVLIVALSLAGQLIVQGAGLWWDEAVYRGLAKNIPDYYSLDSSMPVESFRPPLFPFLLAPFAGHMGAMKMLVLAVAMAGIGAVYAMALRFGKSTALLTAFFLSTHFFFVFFAGKLLAEPLFMLFLSLSLLYFVKWSETMQRNNLAISGVFTGLAFITRYFASVLLLSYALVFLVLLVRKRASVKSIPVFLAPFLLTLAPWLILSTLTYGSPLGAYFTNMHVYAVSSPQSFVDGFVGAASALSFMGPLILLFVVFRRREAFSQFLPFTLTAILTLAVYLLIPHKEPRYFFTFLPVFAVLAAAGTNKILSRSRRVNALALPVVMLLSFLTMALGLQAAAADVNQTALVEAALYLRNISAPSDSILTQSYPFVYAVSERRAIPYCTLDSQQTFDACQEKLLRGSFEYKMIESALARKPRFALSYAFEPANPPQAREWLERHFTKIKSFHQFGNPDAVVVYRLG